MAGGRGRRIKGDRREREIVALHNNILGIKAERVPLSGAARYQGNGEDIDIRTRSGDVLRCQVKAMSTPRGIKGVIGALGAADALFIRLDRQYGDAHPPPPLVVVPWATWEKLLR